MDKDRADVPLFTEFLKLGNVVLIKRFHGPSAGVSAENLHARATELEGTLDREGETAGNRDMEAYSHKCLFSSLVNGFNTNNGSNVSKKTVYYFFLINLLKSSSLSIFTPRLFALSYFDP